MRSNMAQEGVGTSVEERRGKGSPLQRLMQAGKKLFKALSVIAAEASENEVVSTQINLIINEVAKMKSLILEATHEVAGLQGELRATRETMNTGSKRSMAEVVRKSIPGDLYRRPTSPKPKEAIVVRELETNAATRRTVEVTQGRKRFPQIKIVGISEDITDEELPARLVTQNNLQCTAEDFTLAKSWRGREGKTACFEITKQAHEALREGCGSISSGPAVDSLTARLCPDAKTAHSWDMSKNSVRKRRDVLTAEGRTTSGSARVATRAAGHVKEPSLEKTVNTRS
ncbi:hypothetical protein HPB52_010446 [Rhipicephalus sanguineus]|uniref:Uncharacterized protein n=1 Tax=Rhipicephalus sanguineus TaxID=34632 RepID=A0A9D4PRA5_RHISA|nr:hypothetical protein HPB52_010446 [Rhipicephalus sanguineus]